MSKKPFKETKVGKFLLEKAPGFLSSSLPDKGVLGVIKNLIDTDSNLTSEDRAQMHNELLEIYSLEVQDRDSARKREVGVKSSGFTDYMFTITGLVGLAVFMFIVYSIVFLTVPENNKELFIHLIGICEGIVISIFTYYFGGVVTKNK
jgi:hypothetical protein